LYGWERAISNIFIALLTFSLINIGLLVGCLIVPSFYQYLPVLPSESGYGVRFSGLAGDPTHLAGFFSVTLLLMFALRRRYHRGFCFFTSFLLFLGLLSTGSRNSILSLFVGSTLALFASSDLNKISKNLVSLSIVFALLVQVLYLCIPSSDMLVDGLFRVSDSNAFVRFDIWRDIYDLASALKVHELLFGGGYLFVQDLYGGSPYNAFARTLFNQGLLFSILFFVVLVQVVVLAKKDASRLRRGLVFALLGYWFSFSMFLDTLFAEFFHVSELPLWLAVSIVATSGLRDVLPADLSSVGDCVQLPDLGRLPNERRKLQHGQTYY
jgi:hypothetical protein